MRQKPEPKPGAVTVSLALSFQPKRLRFLPSLLLRECYRQKLMLLLIPENNDTIKGVN